MGRKFSNSLVFILLACTTISCMSVSALAFDGKRKGFVLGGGIGFAPIAHRGGLGGYAENYYQIYSPSDTVFMYISYSPQYMGRTRQAVALHMDIGLGWDEHNVLFIRNQQAFYRTTYLQSQGISSVCWSHYFGTTEKVVFSTVGVGFFSTVDWSTWSGKIGIGNGVSLMVGAGYQIKRHFSLELNFSQGPVNSGLSRCSNLALTLNTLMY